VNRDTIQPLAREASQQLPELSRASHRVDAPNREAGERLEQFPPAGTDGEPALAEVGPDGVEDARAELRPVSFEVEQELGSRCGSGKEVVQLQSRSP